MTIIEDWWSEMTDLTVGTFGILPLNEGFRGEKCVYLADLAEYRLCSKDQIWNL